MQDGSTGEGADGLPVRDGERPDSGVATPALAAAPPETNSVIVAIAPEDRVIDVPNEAIPDGPPPEAAAAQGSIPAAHRHRVWARLQATNWRLFLVRFVSASLAVVGTVALVPGLAFAEWRFGLVAVVGLVFGLVNAFVKPLLQFVALRFIFSTYGIVVVAINVVVLLLVASLMSGTFEASGALPVILGGALLGLLSILIETILGATPPVLNRDYKERNGLP